MSGKEILGGIAIVLIIVLGILGSIATQHNHHDQIKTWAGDNGYSVDSIELCYFSKGPYWYVDEDTYDVYEVHITDKLEKHRRAYFCIGLFSFDHEFD